ncbi:hypothetical protein F3Y22_tig00004630pilonHSYRG00058 [Hibiscus syriacus]|uniref:Uncharacterized protein n=1 Tax=Hibiscus syriacus TaxID=106335 RepID=A0A6A3CMH4_HIBSY|nr:hypothetical protein F3Y22_tig00004630pilonHSYRG00058 [Hibiscus syriacus]
MSTSIGASCAKVYLMRKHQKEKMKRMEEERKSRGENSGAIEEKKPTTVVGGRSKVHPGNFTSTADQTQQGSNNAP